MSFVLIDISIGLFIGYWVASISESCVHRFVGHSQLFWPLWRKAPLFGYLSRSRFQHAVIHHIWTYRSDFVTQFESETQKSTVDRRVNRLGDASIVATAYGLRPTWSGMLMFVAPTIAVILALAFCLSPWSALAAAPLLFATPALSRLVHPHLHRKACNNSDQPLWLAWLLAQPYFRIVARHHFLHHKYPNCNFNLLLGGDWLLGVHREPSQEDLEEMRRLGI